MGYYVGVCLSFSASDSPANLKLLADIAKTTLEGFPGDEYDGKYTKMMLKDVAADPNRYVHGGNKGDMFVWSGVWNYYNVEDEEEYLKKFLLNIWKLDLEDNNLETSIMFDFDHAMLFVNPEQSDTTYLYEFSLKQADDDKYLPEVITRTDTSSLSWNQY